MTRTSGDAVSPWGGAMGHFARDRAAVLRGIWLVGGALAFATACVPAGDVPDGSGPGTPPPPTTAPPVTGGAIAVQTREVPGLGAVLTGPDGRTVYLFGNDSPGHPTCLDACAGDWPPLTTTAPPIAGASANPALLATTRRPDGSTQVVYNGHPLYYYVGDELAGQANGQTVNSNGGSWYAISPAGNKIEQGGG
ncbi:COG4315 family predicted lipoprotein [Saccharopolyspora shandongensis]|uniref:COG4315 family predicted lipoprotein n=1 Tax=Saccharopolyspora shandongensis TaxID=418495 RepID=UPI0033CD2B9F